MEPQKAIMNKWIKIVLWTILGLLLLGGVALGAFVYKVKYGFATYETDPPAVTIPDDQPAILVYSKATGFRHAEAIEAAEELFRQIGEEENWFIYVTEESGIINEEQLSQFEAIIWNNSTGRTLTDEQRVVVERYVDNGGAFLGIHGAGDDSHHWPWYSEMVLGATFSHHPMNPQLQETAISLSPSADSALVTGLPEQWLHTDEYYVFDQQPSGNGFAYLLQLDGTAISVDGNMLWITDKDFGMGKVHPVAWWRDVNAGRTFYTSLGHHADAIRSPELKVLLRNVLRQAVR